MNFLENDSDVVDYIERYKQFDVDLTNHLEKNNLVPFLETKENFLRREGDKTSMFVAEKLQKVRKIVAEENSTNVQLDARLWLSGEDLSSLIPDIPYNLFITKEGLHFDYKRLNEFSIIKRNSKDFNKKIGVI